MVDQDSSSGRRFVGYVYVSPGISDADAQKSIAAQKQAIQELARKKSLRNVGWCVDEEPGSEDSDDEDGRSVPRCVGSWLTPSLPTPTSAPCCCGGSPG